MACGLCHWSSPQVPQIIELNWFDISSRNSFFLFNEKFPSCCNFKIILVHYVIIQKNASYSICRDAHVHTSTTRLTDIPEEIWQSSWWYDWHSHMHESWRIQTEIIKEDHSIDQISSILGCLIPNPIVDQPPRPRHLWSPKSNTAIIIF